MGKSMGTGKGMSRGWFGHAATIGLAVGAVANPSHNPWRLYTSQFRHLHTDSTDTHHRTVFVTLLPTMPTENLHC